jgi:hypothetical protein
MTNYDDPNMKLCVTHALAIAIDTYKNGMIIKKIIMPPLLYM